MKYKSRLSALLLVLVLGACRAPPAATTAPTATPSIVPTRQPTPTVADSATPIPGEASPTPSSIPLVIRVEPTCTPRPGDERMDVGALPIGQPGHQVNLTFGYRLQYPPTWFTGFGNRPLLASFSNLDPGTYNRDSMRAQGCLIQVNASVNVYAIPLPELMAQLPRSFPDARTFDLGGEQAVLVPPSGDQDPVVSETVFVPHNDWLIVLTFDHARDAAQTCRPAWENMLATWRWLTPEFATYRNTEYGYALSYPRAWYRFNAFEQGILISSEDPTGATSLTELAKRGMLVQSDVVENREGLPLKAWLAERDWQIDLTNDIPLNGLVGVRLLSEGPVPGTERLSGYFEGPLGDVHLVTCLYPKDRREEYQPIANAIIYSFSF
jgi:hypothetical protein